MGRDQRIILCVGLGAVLAVAAVTGARLVTSGDNGGWFMYAPGSEPQFPSSTSDADVLKAAGVWVVAVACWTWISWRLFRKGHARPT